MLDRNGEVLTIAGDGLAGYLDGSALQRRLLQPADAQIAPHGDLYIADAGNHLLRVLRAGTMHTWAGAFMP
jgi:hypothetical protein